MKSWTSVFLIIIFSTSGVSAQAYSSIDRHALNAPRKISKDLPALTTYLLKDYQTDLEKVRSFYIWIAHNIDYDQSAYKKGRKRVNRSNEDVLDRRQAICFGYTTLFKEMCERANIPCEIVYGYTKNRVSGVVDLTTANHAWNAVMVDGEWRLLDITWGSGNEQAELETFFLLPAEEIIYSHLPADPMWQLLDCPVKPGIFRKAQGFVKAAIESRESCFNFQDSISAFLNLSPIERQIKSTLNSYQFNPVVENKEELGHTYMDFVSVLSDRAAVLELTDSIAAIKTVHLQIISIAGKAEQLIQLYDHQKENLAYSHFNYAIALSRELKGHEQPKLVLEEMLFHFETAKQMLEQLPGNFILDNALVQIEEYVKWVQDY